MVLIYNHSYSAYIKPDSGASSRRAKPLKMKHLHLLYLCFLVPLLSWSQEATLFQNASRVGGFGAPISEFSTIKGRFGVQQGGGGAVIVNGFYFGLFGLSSNFVKVDLEPGRYEVDFSYGGLWIGYTPMDNRVVHPYFSGRIGWGSVILNPSTDNQPDRYDPDNIFTVTPEAGIEVNVFRWFRIAGALGYRFVSGVELKEQQLSNSDFSNFFGGLTLRFGGFGYPKPDKNKE